MDSPWRTWGKRPRNPCNEITREMKRAFSAGGFLYRQSWGVAPG